MSSHEAGYIMTLRVIDIQAYLSPHLSSLHLNIYLVKEQCPPSIDCPWAIGEKDGGEAYPASGIHEAVITSDWMPWSPIPLLLLYPSRKLP